MPQLSPSEQIRLRDALLAAYPVPETLWDLVDSIDQNHLLYIGTSTNYPKQIRDLVAAASAASWALQLLEAAGKNRLQDHALSQLVETFGPRLQLARLDPYDTCCLAGSNLLLNRKRLRSALRGLTRPGGKRILVVRDEPLPSTPGIYRTKAGKSHTMHLVFYLRELTGAFETIYIDLEELAEVVPGGSGSQVQPIDLANEIVDLMRLDQTTIPDPPNDSQWARWVRKFGNVFEGALRNDDHNWWILIDGFNAVLLPQQTLDLIKRIAKIASLSLDRVRLVLLGYTDSFPPETVGPYVETERLLSGAALEEATDELGRFFARVCIERQVDLTAERVAALVSEVLENPLLGPENKPIPYHALVPSIQGCLARLQGN